jgi:hypothetical protein
MKKPLLIFFILLFSCILRAQVENVPLSDPVYIFIKEMSVKKIISGYDDDNPNLSREDAAGFLKKIDKKKTELSGTEKELLEKFKPEFIPEESNKDNTWKMFGTGKNFINNLGDFFSNKQKYLYFGGKQGSNIYFEGIGNIYTGHEFKPNDKVNTLMMDGGFRVHGTIFKNLGYFFDFNKGAIIGQQELAPFMEPRLRSDFKFNENTEKFGNYDRTNAYLKYRIEPFEDANLSVQFGREKLTYGYGYGSKLILSGENPDMDFLKMNFNYGVIRFSSIFASMPGYFSDNRDERYTKYFSAHRFKVALDDLFDAAISDVVVYADRIEFAYLNPILFWHFAEKSLQDRDNKNIAFDFQTKFLKNVEFQWTSFVDDDEQFAMLTGKTNRNQKFGYQAGAFVYVPFIRNLSFVVEYTKIRPYTYSHWDVKNNYTSYGINLGHRMGPNADEIFTRLSYNISDWGRFNFEYRHIRKGENVYDDNGNLIKNVGGDVAITFRDGIDDPDAKFLDGERVNTDNFILNFRFIPIRNYIFNFYYVYNINRNITKGFNTDMSYAYVKLNIEY